MDARHRSIQILGWLSIIAGYGLALLLIRGIFIGITRGFGANRFQAFWVLLGYLIFFALAVYLFTVGRRLASIAKASPRPRARLGWGRILLGTIFLYGSAVNYFHIIPARGLRHFDPTNELRGVTMKVAAIVIASGCILLIFSGMWRGFRPRRTEINECKGNVEPTISSGVAFGTITPVVDSATSIGRGQNSVFLPLATLLLCIPCWGVATYGIVLILTIKLVPHSARSLISASAVTAPAILAVISPFCWIAGLIVTYRRRKFGVVRLAGWVFVAASGIAMVCTWIVLEHFNRR
jgi:hypothetical protein